jgi:Domain of unknown function (DUF4258)
MTPAEALRQVRGYATAGRVRFTSHAYQRMSERGARRQDVIEACVKGERCSKGSEPGRWKVTGPDLDGDDLTAVVVIEDGVLVVTMF